MFAFLSNIPIIPLLTLTFVGGFFVYQIRTYLREQKKKKTPQLPTLELGKLKDTSQSFLQKMGKIKPKSGALSTKKITRVNTTISVTIAALVLAATGGVFYVNKDRPILFSPRAAVSPTLPPFIATPTPKLTQQPPTQTPTPIVAQTTTAPGLSEGATPTQTILAQYGFTPTELIAPTEVVVTIIPTSPPTSTQTPTATATPFILDTPTPVVKRALSATTPTGVVEEIPQAGISASSVILVLLSTALIVIGFAL